MAVVTEDRMPAELDNWSITAHEPQNKQSLLPEFREYVGGTISLCDSLPIIVHRKLWNGRKTRNLSFLTGTAWIGEGRALLAEKL